VSNSTHNLICQNNSSNTGSFCLYQQMEGLPSGMVPLAWLTQAAAPTTQVQFSWQIQCR
jgi:hypothetical protein